MSYFDMKIMKEIDKRLQSRGEPFNNTTNFSLIIIDKGFNGTLQYYVTQTAQVIGKR